jgi:tetratricopeptide (TPR) repeat protein
MTLPNWLQQLIKFLNRPISLKWASSTTTQPQNCHSREGGNPPTQPDQYLPFLLELLQLKAKTSDPKVVYPFLAQHTDKLNLTLAATAQQWFHSQLDPNNSQKNQDLARNFNNLAIDIQQFPLGSRLNNLEIAITLYQAALTVYTRQAFPYEWAATQNNLGEAYRNRIKGDRVDNLEQAIGYYQAVLEVYTREAFPQDWAMTQNNLANAYNVRIKGGRADNLEMAIRYYQAALEVYTREAFPQDWAMTQNNLAIAYRNRIKGERVDNLEQAIGYYQAVLEVYTREAFPQDWAMTQNNLAIAYSDRIKGERADNLEQAIRYFQAALEVRTREAFPEQWAMTQNNLANAYSDRIKGDRADNLEQAIGYYQAALEVYTREAFPQYWADTQNNLANAYRNRIKGDRADNLEQAIAYYQAALEVRTREAFPEDWAMTQENLAYAYIDLDNHTQAIKHFKAALEVLTPSDFPLSALKAGRNLGNLGYNLENWEMATCGYDNAIRAVEQSRNWATSPHSKRQILENALPIYGKMIQACIQLQRYDQALLTVERSKSRTLIELLHNADLIPKNATPEQQQRYRQLNREIAALEQSVGDDNTGDNNGENNGENNGDATLPPKNGRGLVSETLHPTPDTPHPNQLQHLLQQRNNLLAEINDPDFNAIQIVRPKLPDFGQLLTPETALIEWYLPQDPDLGGYVFIVTLEDNRHQIQTHHYTAEQRQALDQFNQTYFSDYRDPTTWFNQLAPRLAQLAQLLDMDKLLAKIPPTCHSLILVPHLYLHLFPLHGLTGNRPQNAAFRPPNPPNLGGTGIQNPQQASIYDSDTPQNPPSAHHRASDTPQNWGAGGASDTPQNWGAGGASDTPQNWGAGGASDTPQNWGAGGASSHTPPLPTPPTLPPSPHTPPSPHPLPHLFPQGIRYAPSCQILEYLQNRQSRQQRGTGQQFFAVENPTQDLPYTEMEVEFIRPSFDPNTYILKNTAASKSALNSPETLAKLRQSFLAHFACHGGFDSENPLNSALILAGDAPPNLEGRRTLTLRDGRRFDTEHQGLTLREIYANLELPACRLVVLSACETGLLDSQLTDEYIGLVSGFLHAGSRSVVSSFWCVDDFATALLSIRFYQELTPEISVAKALQSAQAWLQTRTKSDLLAWCANDLKMSADEVDEVEYQLMDFDDIPFADIRYWLAFFASGL